LMTVLFDAGVANARRQLQVLLQSGAWGLNREG
jgi:hypothetical protein